MPRQPHYITRPVTIAKSDIALYAALQGKANAKPYTLEGKTHEPGRLKFHTFAGARCDDGLYRGVYRFEAGDFKDCESADVNQLPQCQIGKSYKKTTTKHEIEAT